MRQGITFGLIIHLLLILLPLLWQNLAGQQRAYALPKGSGTASVGGGEEEGFGSAHQETAQENRKKFAVNPHSSIIFFTPDIDSESKVLEMTRLGPAAYAATGGKDDGEWGGGAGGRWAKAAAPRAVGPRVWKGPRSGFSASVPRRKLGLPPGLVADFNMIRAFAEITGFQVESFTENIPIDALKRFPKHHAPPFVYITGTRGLELSAAEAKILRWYLLDEGGMLFADSGSRMFNNAFRAALRQACPELGWTDIPNDDVIYQQPFEFPNGVLPLFHHSGERGLGLKYEGRWIAFYHPGDLGDAWRNDHAGMHDAIALRAFKLGVNIMNYAFNAYTDLHPAQ